MYLTYYSILFITSLHLSPPSTLQTRQLYFVTDSAVFELFKFASRFGVQVTEALEEEGLSIMAGKFDALRQELRVK